MPIKYNVYLRKKDNEVKFSDKKERVYNIRIHKCNSIRWAKSLRPLHSLMYSILCSVGYFRGPCYYVAEITKDGQIVHRSCLFPSSPRFRMMNENDYQIGNTLTRRKYRRLGLATFAANFLLEKFHYVNVWYLANSLNLDSNRVATKCGMLLVGTEVRSDYYLVRVVSPHSLQKQR